MVDACAVHLAKLPLYYKEERFHEFHRPSLEETKQALRERITERVDERRKAAIEANAARVAGETQYRALSC
jgi:hypothetical protein